MVVQPLAGLAKIHLARLMQPRHHVHALPGQSRQRDIIAIGPVPQQDVTGLETLPQPAEQAQIVLVQVAQHHLQQRPAGQGEQHHQLEHGKAAAGLLTGGLRIFLLVGRGVGCLHRTAIHRLDRPPLQGGAGAGTPFGRLGGAGLEHLPEKAFAGEAQGEEPLPAVGAFVRTGKQVNGNEFGEVCGQLLEGALAEVAGGAAAQGGEPGAEGGEERRVH